jgi:hypothetical protein
VLLLFCFCFFAFAFLLLLSLVLLVSLPAFAFYFYGSNFGHNYRHFGRSHKLFYINDLHLTRGMRGLDRFGPSEEWRAIYLPSSKRGLRLLFRVPHLLM